MLCIINKLPQYSAKPAKVHYVSVKRISRYLWDSIDDGLHYWSQCLNASLPDVPYLIILHDNQHVNIPDFESLKRIGYADSD